MPDNKDLILKNLWYLALAGEHLKIGKLIGRTIANERIVFGRDRSGKPFALKDNCPHRGVPLSLGHVLDNGNIQCCYHGWEFDAEGTCKNIPALPPETKGDVSKIRAWKYPVDRKSVV